MKSEKIRLVDVDRRKVQDGRRRPVEKGSSRRRRRWLPFSRSTAGSPFHHALKFKEILAFCSFFFNFDQLSGEQHPNAFQKTQGIGMNCERFYINNI